MESQEIRRILEVLRTIKVDIEFIKDNMVDADMVLTHDEKQRLDRSLDELEKGEAFFLEDLENA